MRTEIHRLPLLCTLLVALVAFVSAADDRRVADAMKRQDTQAVQELIAERADVNVPHPDGATALHWAAYWDDLPSAQLLLRAGAQVNAVNENGITPLSL